MDAGLLGWEARASVSEAERAAFQAMAEAVQTMAAVLAEQPICGRSYDGRCPGPRPEPVGDSDARLHAELQQELTHTYICDACGTPFDARREGHVMNVLGTWHWRCYHPSRHEPRREPEPVEADDEPCGDPDCYTCGVTRREHEQEQQVGVPPRSSREQDEEYRKNPSVCNGCGEPITSLFDRVGKSGGNLGARFLYFHRRCAPEKHPG